MAAAMKPRVYQIRCLNAVSKPLYLQTIRHVHTTNTRQAFAAATPETPEIVHQPAPSTTQQSPLAILPLSTVLRTYLVTAMSSSPTLLNACFAILGRMANSQSVLMDPDRNPILKWVLKKTFYAQFCVGETRQEVQQALQRMRALGYQGVILEYALEVLEVGKGVAGADSEVTKREIETWRKGMLESVRMVNEGDFVGLKWSGLGAHALHLLKTNQPPTPSMSAAMHEVCDLGAQKGVSLLADAEEESTNKGIETWSLELQRRYNRDPAKGAVMYTTYQAYLKAAPEKIARHLAVAQREGFTLGVKIVRGAYLNSEPRHLIHDSIEDTHAAYNELAACLLKRQYGGILQPLDGHGSSFPSINVVLATHNQDTVRKALALRNAQAARGEERVPLAFAQLHGMADEVSCELLQAGEAQRAGAGLAEKDIDVPKAYKCAAWGTTRECLNFLLRRAAENKDAASRTVDTRRVMGRELWRRMKAAAGLA